MSIHPVDAHVGTRVKKARMALGMSQEEVGAMLGVTFQQIQKYEKGSNRICASKLFELAKLLGVDAGYFFDAIEADNDDENISDRGSQKDTILLVKAFNSIQQPVIRRKLVSLARSIAGQDDLY